MMIWLVFAVMTAAVMAGLLLPLLRGRQAAPAGDRAQFDRAVFRDQLAELDRDVARGTIAPAEAEAARNEISRRLLQTVSLTRAEPKLEHRPLAAIVATLLVPAVAVPLYLKLGNPGLPDVPLAQRLDSAIANNDFDALIAKVERHLAAEPNDATGWNVLAPAYRSASRWEDAANAYQKLMTLTKPTPELLADYGEMIVFAAQGMVTADARKAFTEALRLDPKLPKARFYDGIALKQEGKTDEARAALTAFLAESPAGASWLSAVEAELSNMDSRAPALTAEQMAQGADAKTIRAMVDGLETRLKEDGSDLEGWQRLIRARTVLNENEKAKSALATARKLFKDKAEALAALDGLAKELGI